MDQAAKDKIVATARVHTKYDTLVISDPDAATLLESAMEELQDDVGRDLEFSLRGEKRALLWLTCLFFKVHTGEIGAAAFTLGEIEAESLDTDSSFWLSQYRTKVNSIEGSLRFGHASGGRDTRRYGDDV